MGDCQREANGGKMGWGQRGGGKGVGAKEWGQKGVDKGGRQKEETYILIKTPTNLSGNPLKKTDLFLIGIGDSGEPNIKCLLGKEDHECVIEHNCEGGAFYSRCNGPHNNLFSDNKWLLTTGHS